MSDQNLYYLNKCYQIAEQSTKNGNHPFGALIFMDGEIIVTSENEVVSKNDVTLHAELLLIQKAQKVLSPEQLSNCILYTSTEPCAMCCGAIYWAGINDVVFGASNLQLSKIAGSTLEISSREILSRGTRKISINDYSHIQKYSQIHSDFW